MWLQVAVLVEEGEAERVSDLMMAQGALSVSMEDAGDQPLFEPKPGETPLWLSTKVTALFEGTRDRDHLRVQLTSVLGSECPLVFSDLEDQVWERAWMEHFKPMQFGQRLWICPTGFTPPDPGAVNVILDPGLAFGTGTHPTTALCLEWLEGLPLEGARLVDFGCGSGILAVAALKLGCIEAHGIDIDPQALTASKDNAIKNDVEDRLSVSFPNDPNPRVWEVVVANILAGPLVELKTAILTHLKPGGFLALSGLLESQAECVMAAYAEEVDFDPQKVLEGWVILSGRRKSAKP
jgi:ribosomal protein L11 methyltransferase